MQKIYRLVIRVVMIYIIKSSQIKEYIKKWCESSYYMRIYKNTKRGNLARFKPIRYRSEEQNWEDIENQLDAERQKALNDYLDAERQKALNDYLDAPRQKELDDYLDAALRKNEDEAYIDEEVTKDEQKNKKERYARLQKELSDYLDEKIQKDKYGGCVESLEECEKELAAAEAAFKEELAAIEAWLAKEYGNKNTKRYKKKENKKMLF